MPSKKADAPIGFVGLGRMGAPMARRVARLGRPLRLFDLRAEATESLATGPPFLPSSTLADLATGAGIVITMLPNAASVRAAVLGDEGSPGFASSLEPGAIVIDMSSSHPPETRRLAASLAERGLTMIDAPVSGGVVKAVDGTLAIMVGGDDGPVEQVRPVLETMGRIFRTGPVGSGHALKALNNYVSAAGFAAACEAVHIGHAFGLAPATIIEVINASTGRNNSTENKFGRHIFNAAYDSGFALALMAKDLTTAEALGRELGFAAPLLAACAQLWRQADGRLGPGADHTELFKYLEG